jgi:hypothetical protein
VGFDEEAHEAAGVGHAIDKKLLSTQLSIKYLLIIYQ